MPEKYDEMACILGLPGRGALFDRVDLLLQELGMPETAGNAGAVGYREAIPELAMAAFGDLSIRTNPRMPLVAELESPARGLGLTRSSRRLRRARSCASPSSSTRPRS